MKRLGLVFINALGWLLFLVFAGGGKLEPLVDKPSEWEKDHSWRTHS